MAHKLFAVTRNNKPVYLDMKNSHAATHIIDVPGLDLLVKKALLEREVKGREAVFDVDFGEPVGMMDLVTTNTNDEIVYAKRLNRETYTRFVKNKSPVQTSHVTIILKKKHIGYELWSAWVGMLTPVFPDDIGATSESRKFWSNHALVWGRQPIQQGTETQKCPW